MRRLDEFIERFLVPKAINIKVIKIKKDKSQGNIFPYKCYTVKKEKWANYTEEDIDEVNPIDLFNTEVYLKEGVK